jgi:transcriptional regulator with XRE-family HTH domain
MLNKSDLMEYLHIFGVNLRRHRNKLGMTYDSVHEQTGISKSIMSRIENGQTAPSFETFVKLIVSYGISTDFFYKQPKQMAAASDLNSNTLAGGFKFERRNFNGRPALSAEVEEIKTTCSQKLQVRRGWEENIIVISGGCTITFGEKDSAHLSFGDIYTLPKNRQGYEISSEFGAKIIRIITPLSKDVGSVNRYLLVQKRAPKRSER